MRAAASLLAAATTAGGLAALLRAARLAGDSDAPLEPEVAEALGLTGGTRARLFAGSGAMRALLLDLDGPEALRETLDRICGRLSSRAPHVLWLVAIRHQGLGRCGLIGWRIDGRARRTVAFLWEPARVVDSDAETLCALHAARSSDDDELLHARIVEILGRDTLTRRFYRALESQVASLAGFAPHREERDRRAVTLLYVSRLLFLSFLEAKGWLDGDRAFLTGHFDRCMQAGGGFHRRVLRPLFFGTLNTPARRRALVARSFGRIPFLNGGLFCRAPLERAGGRWEFPDEPLGALFSELFQRYRFVAREDSATWSEASVDPEMLGRAFESLMSVGDRKTGGVYFTPHQLVGRVTDQALAAWTATHGSDMRSIRILDPACGSGAFLVHALERLAESRRAAGEPGDIAAIRRDVLARSIFGVDRNPTAVWLCELRLWLSVVIELDEADPLRVPPLPNLDRNVRVGDALAGAGFEDALLTGCRPVVALRRRYVRAVGSRKAALARALDREERRRSLARLDAEIASLRHARREQVLAMRSRNLFGERTGIPDKGKTRQLRSRLRAARSERQRVARGGALPFSFAALFADAQASGGFDVAIGNPPWVRLHRIPEALRARFRESFQVFRDASWRAGAARARASTSFASQVDLSALFVERSLRLLRPGGIVALLLPVKLWRSLSGGGVRRLLLEHHRLLRVEDLGDDDGAFDAAVYPSLLVAAAGGPASAKVTIAVPGTGAPRGWRIRTPHLALDESPGAPWLLLSPPARAAFDRLRDAGLPLGESHFGAPRLGVKSGCNAAFLVRVVADAGAVAVVQDANGEQGRVESALLRPALRGDAVAPWRRHPADECIVWTHDDRGPLRELPPQARRWLGRHYGTLAGRSDAARSRRWWSLFRVDAAVCDAPRVVWADFGRRPRALVLLPGDPVVPLNTCYVLRVPNETDAWALTAILNSLPAAAWLNAIAEPARGGFRRYLGWTVGHLPLPRDWLRVRDDLAGAAARAARDACDDVALQALVLDAYGLTPADITPLLATCRT